jgi:enediyne biosynthesis protein E4
LVSASTAAAGAITAAAVSRFDCRSVWGKQLHLATPVWFLLALVPWSNVAAQAPIAFVDEGVLRGVADPATNSTGPAFADYDNDGDLDVFVPVEDLAPGLADRLWENDGKGMFKDVAAARGVDNAGSMSRGASWGDYDNDGDVDLLVANMPPGERGKKHVPTTLFKNLLKETGKANFENVTRAAGVLRAGNAEDEKIGGIGDTGGGVAWADYDGDGWLDFFWKNADGEVDNALFKNNRDGTFTDVTAAAGVALQGKLRESNAQGSPNFTDVDEDGLLDLLVTNEGDSKILFRNKGDGTFEDITKARKPPSGVVFGNPGNAQGACIGDVDNDGDLDVYLPMADQANRLILSRLKEKKAVTFDDVTLKSGAGDTGGARGCTMADFDNDGWLDIYVNNGGPSNTLINDVIAGFPPFVQFYIAWQPANNTLLRNNRDGTFTDVTTGSGAEGLGIGSGVGAADINGDGFADIFATNRTYYALGKQVSPTAGQSRLFVNQGNANHWVKITLRARRSNRSAIGARVTVTAGDLVQHRETTSAHGYNSTNDPTLLFGLGERTSIDTITVRWPSGSVQTIKAPRTKRLVTIVEPAK